MRPLECALKYMDILFSGADLDGLKHLLADDLTFNGPLYQFNSAQDYINSLKSDPPKDFHYKMIHSFEQNSLVCLVYQFSKPGVSVPMTQLFDVKNDKISNILLIFDTGAFS